MQPPVEALEAGSSDALAGRGILGDQLGSRSHVEPVRPGRAAGRPGKASPETPQRRPCRKVSLRSESFTPTGVYEFPDRTSEFHPDGTVTITYKPTSPAGSDQLRLSTGVLRLSTGVEIDLGAIAPIFSDGGGFVGYNLQSIEGVGVRGCWVLPSPEASTGVSVGVSFSENLATGTGGWSGPFVNTGASVGFLGVGEFHSPPGDGGRKGYSVGVGAGPLPVGA